MSETSERTAIVVGGGIGGLATAVALLRRGWTVDVLERAPAFAEVGAGLSLWPNALRALDALGLGEQVRARALVETEAGVRRKSGHWLARTDTDEVARRYGPLVMIHRADLLDTLRAAVPAATLRAGTTATEVTATRAAVEVGHSAGTSRADLVVGADGIRSAVRRSVWPDAPEPRYAGYTAWRLVAEPGQRVTAGGETWGRGERFGLAPLSDGRVYVYATANRPAGEHCPDGELTELRRRFGKWHDPIPAVLAAASEDAVLRNDIADLPPLTTYVSGRAALLGDAAHATTPNMGQGACMALEDAVVLAALLDAHPTVEAALEAYDTQRRPRTQRIARRSHRIGVVAQWSSPPAVALRDAVMQITPKSSLMRSLDPVLSWTPAVEAPRSGEADRRNGDPT
jgi:2-polyprenyl-6-methoxyphenol hydroxylase-like FAD-dependent oxidoreductase